MMVLTKAIYICTLCILGVFSQDSTDGTKVKNETDSKPITKASKVSEFFIGDLLRTADKDQLESASSVNSPIATTPEYVHAGLLNAMPDESRMVTNYQIQGRDYSEEESLPYTQNSRNFHDVPTPRMNNAPVNVFEKFLIKQAGVIERNIVSTEGVQPISPRYSHPADRPHRKKEDCKKHSHPVASSEERYDRSAYHSDGPSHVDDYRNAPSTYHQNYEPDDSHQVQSHDSHTSSYPSRSKSYASAHDSNSKSKSGESYTRTKSTSTSKTVEPSDKQAKVHVFSNTGSQGYKKVHQQGPQSGGVVVYKTRDSPNRPTPHSDGRPGHYTNPQADEAPVNQYYEEYPPQAPRKPSHSSRGRPSAHSSQRPEYDDRSVPYDGPTEGHYDTSKRPHADYDSREQYNSPHVPQPYHRPEPAPGSDGRGREQHYGNPAEAYNAQPAPKPRRKHQRPTVYRAPEDNGHHPSKYSHQPEQQEQSYRARKERPQHQYSGYVAEDPRAANAPDRNPHTLRSPERKPQGYAYEQDPRVNSEQYQRERRPPTRESRSSAQYTKPSQAQSRNSDSVDASAHQALITKESNPHESRSVSYSESTYNMGGPVRSKSMSIKAPVQARNYEEPQKMVNPLNQEKEDLKARSQSFQSSYKPYNSEYPATYMNDQYSPGSHSAEDSAEEPHRPYDISSSSKGKSRTKTKSDITGYKEEYGSHEPLNLDDHFFEKYGISKKAKVIVAKVMEPNLFVADGTRLKQGESDDVPREGERYHEEHPYEHGPVSEEQPYDDGPVSEEEPYERRPIRDEDSYRGKPKGFRPQDLPGTFTELVGANTDFQRSVSFDGQKDSDDELAGYDPSLDELVFRSGVGDPKKVVSSAGARSIVQHHGDGISKIIFNQAAASENKEQFEAKDASEKLQGARSEIVEVETKGDEKVSSPLSSKKSS